MAFVKMTFNFTIEQRHYYIPRNIIKNMIKQEQQIKKIHFRQGTLSQWSKVSD